MSEIHVNDVDLSIWSFWSSVLNKTDELIYLVEKTPITIEEWRKQRTVYLEHNEDDMLALGFATLFLNRTNRSGIIKDAGVIGGIAQNGDYKIDCRFTRESLVRRIRRIAKYKKRIHLHRRDAIAFMRELQGLYITPFICIDPPYYHKGSSLYTSYYCPKDHAILANAILDLECPWIVTYDNAPDIAKLYAHRRQFEFDINYSLETKRVGTELLIPCKGLRLPALIRGRQVNRPQYRAA